MKLIETNYLGIGIGYDLKNKELSIHLFVWCLEIKFK